MQDDAWLRKARAQVGKFGMSRSIEGGETATRAGPGFPIRFFQKWFEILSSQEDGFSNSQRSKPISKLNAERLYRLIFVRNRISIALEDG